MLWRQAPWHSEQSRRPASSGTRSLSRPAARRARAEAQVWAIVAARLRKRLGSAELRPATDAVLEEVADHRLDPYAAADRLLADLTSEGRG